MVRLVFAGLVLLVASGCGEVGSDGSMVALDEFESGDYHVNLIYESDDCSHFSVTQATEGSADITGVTVTWEIDADEDGTEWEIELPDGHSEDIDADDLPETFSYSSSTQLGDMTQEPEFACTRTSDWRYRITSIYGDTGHFYGTLTQQISDDCSHRNGEYMALGACRIEYRLVGFAD